MASKSNQVGLRVAVKFSNKQAAQELERVLTALDKKFTNKNWLTLDTKQITAMTEAMRELANVKINIEGQKESLAYYESVTKQLEKQVKASERVAKNMKAAGAKELVKQENAEQKDYYNEAQKLLQSIVKDEKTLLTLTGKNKEQMSSIIKDKRSQLTALEKQITHEHYAQLYSEKKKQAEQEITSEKLKQNELIKKNKEKEKQQQVNTKNNERLKNAENAYKRIVEIKTTLHRLDAEDPSVPQLKQELAHLEKVIQGYKRAKTTREEIKKMGEEANLAYQRNVGLIDSKAYQEQQAKLQKEQEKSNKESMRQSKTETKQYIDSLASQIKDLNKAFYATDNQLIRQNLSQRLSLLEAELAKYRELAEWKKTVAKLDNEIETSKSIAIHNAIDKELNANDAKQNAINKAWAGEYYNQYLKNLNERANLEKKIREELVKTTGVQADSIKLEQSELVMLKQKGGYISALASNLLTVRDNIQKYEELTKKPAYNNQVKDFSIEQRKEQIDRQQLAHEEQMLEKQIQQAQTAKELIPLEQRMLNLQLKRLLASENLTTQQLQELSNVQTMIDSLSGKTKAEVLANSGDIKKELSYQRQLKAFNEEKMNREQILEFEAKAAQYEQQKALRAIEDLETSKLAKHVDQERLEVLRQIANSFIGADAKTLQSLTKEFNNGLSGVKHDAKVTSRIETDINNEVKLDRYIESQKEVLKNELQSLDSEKLKGYVLEENRQKILKEINALDGKNKEEVKEYSHLINRNIQLEKTYALESQIRDQNAQNSAQAMQEYYAEQERANLRAQESAKTRQDKINELTAGKELTAEQQKQITNLQQIQQQLTANNLLTMDQVKAIEKQFDTEYKHYQSETKQSNQIENQEREKRLAQDLLATNKKKLEDKIKLLEVSRNSQYVEQEKLKIAKNMVKELNGQSRAQVNENTKNVREYIDALSRGANIARLRDTGTAMNSLSQSLQGLTRYFSGYMIIRRFWQAFKQGLSIIKEVDSALTTLRITLTNFSEKELTQLMDASKQMAISLKTDFSQVLEVIKTVANETESLETIMAKSRPSLILSNLTGLSTSETVEMIQGVTRQYQSQFEALGLTAEEQGMKVADAMVAVSRSLGMDFSTGIKGLAEGIEIMGALSNELKISLEGTLALMASTAEQTRLSFSEIANAFKTTMARTIRISGTDEEISEQDLAKTEKALRGVGIEVRNFYTGEVRSFIDIMDDLAEVWDDLTDSQRGAIGDAMGGARQISTVMAAINVTDRRKELTKIAEESLNASLDAQETWSQSLEAKLQELSNAGSMFWISFINDESYRGFIESLTNLINGITGLTEAFGSVPVAAFGLTTALLVLNRGMRQMMGGLTADLMTYISVKQGKNVVDAQGNVITDVSLTKMIQQRFALTSTTGATIGLTTATVALQTVLTVGLTAAITGLIVLFTKLVGGIKSSAEQAKDLNETFSRLGQTNEQTKTAEKAIDSYEKLTEEIKELNETSEDYLEKQEEIDSLISQISGIDSRYGIILADENKTLDEKLTLLRFINDEREREAAMEADMKLLSGSNLKAKQDEIDSTYYHWLRALEQVERLKEQQAYIGQQAYDEAINSGKSEADAEGARFLAEQELKKELEDSTAAADGLLTRLRDLILYMDTHNTIVDHSVKVLGYSNSSHIELSETVAGAREEIFKETSILNENNKALKKNAEAAETAEQKQARLAQEAKEGQNSFIEFTKTLDELTELLEDVELNGITLENFDNDLLEEFTGNITDAAEVQEYLKQKIEETEKAQILAYEKMRQNDEVFYQTQVQNSQAYNTYKQNLENAMLKLITELRNKGLKVEADALNEKLKMAKNDLDNAQTLAEARAKIEEGLIQGMQKGWSEYYGVSIKQMQENLDFYYKNKEEMDKRNPGYAALAEEMEAYLASYNSIIEIAKDPITIKPPTISSVSSSTSSSSSSSTVDDLDLEINRYHDLERAITRINNALKANEIAQENATPTQKIKLMKEELKLYEELKEAQKALITEQKKEASELKKELKKNGFAFNQDGTLSNYAKRLNQLQAQANKLKGDAKEAKIEEVKALKELADAYEELINETLPDAQNEYRELTNTIKEVQKTQLEFVADIQSQITSALEEELQKRYDATKTALEKEKELYNKQYEDERWEDEFNTEQRKLAEIQAQIDALSRDFSEAGRLKLEQLMEEYKEQQKVIDQMLQDKTHEDGNTRFDEAIDELDQELENLLTPESLAGMVAEALEKGFISLNGEVIKTENLLTQMLENSGELFLATGNLIRTELIDGLKVAQGLMKDISSLNKTTTTSRSLANPTAYSLTPEINTRQLNQTGIESRAANITVSFDQLLNVEGNLDTTLMLDLDNRLRQAMNEVTHSITQALSYR